MACSHIPPQAAILTLHPSLHPPQTAVKAAVAMHGHKLRTRALRITRVSRLATSTKIKTNQAVVAAAAGAKGPKGAGKQLRPAAVGGGAPAARGAKGPGGKRGFSAPAAGNWQGVKTKGVGKAGGAKADGLKPKGELLPLGCWACGSVLRPGPVLLGLESLVLRLPACMHGVCS
jgi:hypothetical protein